jgi:hypothetical protein
VNGIDSARVKKQSVSSISRQHQLAGPITYKNS